MDDKSYQILSRFAKIISDKGVYALARSLGLEAYLNTDSDGGRRLLLRSVDPSFHLRMNGCIVAKQGIIALPPKMLKRIDLKSIRNLRGLDLSKYKITDAANGTMITLYCWDNQWCLSTTRGIYVNDYAIISSSSLMTLFELLLTKHGLSFADFDQNVSYTFIMCHPDYHILPIEELHFVQAFCRIKQDIIECPQFLESILQKTSDLGGSRTNIDKVSYIGSKCMSATDRFVRGDYNQISGFVLRWTGRGIAPDYYIESDITQFLHTFMYQSLRMANIDAKFRHMNFILHVYLNAGQNDHLYNMIQTRFTEDIKSIDATFCDIQRRYNKYLETGEMPMMNEFEKLFSALDRDKPANIKSPAYFDLYFDLLVSCS